MAELNPRRLNRQQLARICGNDPELIKAFEALFAVTGGSADAIELLTVLTEQAQQTADTAAAQQAVQSALLERIADALELLALAPAAEPLQLPEQHVCETCAATREQLVNLARRVDDLETR
jgi:hypothetical protein